MKRILLCIIAPVLALVPFSFVFGEPITHNFDEMYKAPRTLELSGDYKSATTTTDDISYVCTGSTEARFWLDLVYNTKISINLPSTDDQVIVVSPTEAIGRVTIHFYPSGTKYEQLKVYASTDGSGYGEALEAEYVEGRIMADTPLGSHYFKIVNEGNTAISINNMRYTIEENCNCFLYVPE